MITLKTIDCMGSKEIAMFKLIKGDCLEIMKNIPDDSVDLVLTDPPYGTTACKWDNVIPFAPMWEQLNRIIKPNGAICLFGSEPFATELRHSNLKMYRYDWIWDKKQTGNHFLCKKQPLKTHEIICVFSKKTSRYFPQMRKGKMRKKGGAKRSLLYNCPSSETYNDLYYPITILTEFSNARSRKDKLHPTQKPVDLLEYLIKTYTKEGETILDFAMGSIYTKLHKVGTLYKLNLTTTNKLIPPGT